MSSDEAGKVIDRAKDVLNLEQDQELASLLNVSRSTIAAWRRRNSIPAKYLTEIMVLGTVSLNWLLTGIGDRMHLNRTPPPSLSDEQLSDMTGLWVSMLLAKEELRFSINEELRELGDILTDQNLSHLHFLLVGYIRETKAAQADLKREGVLSPNEVFDRLLDKFDLEKDEIPPPPWRVE